VSGVTIQFDTLERSSMAPRPEATFASILLDRSLHDEEKPYPTNMSIRSKKKRKPIDDDVIYAGVCYDDEVGQLRKSRRINATRAHPKIEDRIEGTLVCPHPDCEKVIKIAVVGCSITTCTNCRAHNGHYFYFCCHCKLECPQHISHCGCSGKTTIESRIEEQTKRNEQAGLNPVDLTLDDDAEVCHRKPPAESDIETQNQSSDSDVESGETVTETSFLSSSSASSSTSPCSSTDDEMSTPTLTFISNPTSMTDESPEASMLLDVSSGFLSSAGAGAVKEEPDYDLPPPPPLPGRVVEIDDVPSPSHEEPSTPMLTALSAIASPFDATAGNEQPANKSNRRTAPPSLRDSDNAAGFAESIPTIQNGKDDYPPPPPLPGGAVEINEIDVIAEEPTGKDENEYELSLCIECHQLEDPSSDVPILLCDGCDAPCHLTCTHSPALSAVPEGDWYCTRCCKKQAATDGGIDEDGEPSSDSVYQADEDDTISLFGGEDSGDSSESGSNDNAGRDSESDGGLNEASSGGSGETRQFVGISSPTGKKDKRTAQWNRRCGELFEYKMIHGHCRVPEEYELNKQLGSWVHNQRRQCRRLKEGKKSPMTNERIKKLEEIGFVWDPNDVAWEAKLKDLVTYKKKHGNCFVPAREYKTLGYWVDNQRQQYRLFQDGEKAKITEERIDKLEDMGFVWDASHLTGAQVDDEAWDLRFNELAAYEEKHGDCLVPQRYKPNKQLATWVKTQRKQYRLLQEGKTSSMTDERIAQLEDIGFKWKVRD